MRQRALGAGLGLVLVALHLASNPARAASADGGTRDDVEPLKFRSWVEPPRVRLGEPFVYQLVITHLPAQRYEIQQPGAVGPFELLEQSRNREDGRESATTTFRLKFAVFELGKNRLPDLSFSVVEPDRVGRFTTAGMEVEATSSLSKDAEQKGASLYDIKPPEEIPVRSYRLLWALLAAAAAAALIYGLVRWSRRPRRSRQIEPPPEPLNVRTTAALDQLRKADLPAQGKGREFHFRLSEILRAYLGERYGFEALECTGTELLQAIDRLRAPGLPRDELAAFVMRSDLIKFAKVDASPAECSGALDFGYRLLEQTWKSPEPASPEQLNHVAGTDVDSSHANRPLVP